MSCLTVKSVHADMLWPRTESRTRLRFGHGTVQYQQTMIWPIRYMQADVPGKASGSSLCHVSFKTSWSHKCSLADCEVKVKIKSLRSLSPDSFNDMAFRNVPISKLLPLWVHHVLLIFRLTCLILFGPFLGFYQVRNGRLEVLLFLTLKSPSSQI